MLDINIVWFLGLTERSHDNLLFPVSVLLSRCENVTNASWLCDGTFVSTYLREIFLSRPDPRPFSSLLVKTTRPV